MQDIPIPADETRPLEQIADGIVGLRTLLVNVFAIGDRSRWMLVDAGLYGTAGRIERWAADHFGDTAPAAIVLTHAHFDHVGALETLAERWNVPVYVHPEELPYVTGAKSYPPPDPSVGGGIMARLSAMFPRGPIDIANRVAVLPAEGGLPGMPEWRIVHTPGHSAGHVSFVRDVDRALIVGDAFCTTRQESFLAVATQKPELHGPPAYFTPDWDAARDSVQRLAALAPRVIAPGHGQPLSGADTVSALQTLAARFDEIARPEHGRYVDHPVRG